MGSAGRTMPNAASVIGWLVALDGRRISKAILTVNGRLYPSHESFVTLFHSTACNAGLLTFTAVKHFTNVIIQKATEKREPTEPVHSFMLECSQILSTELIRKCR